MANYIKVSANSALKVKAMVTIIVFCLLTVFSAAMAVYDIVTGKTAFGLMFALAALIFVVLTLLKINSAFGTYIKVKDDTLYMKSWSNNFLPYDVNSGFLAEMVPSKTKLTEIPIDEISVVFVGTKDFIKGNATVAGKKLARALYPYEHSARKAKRNLIEKLDLFYVETVDGDCSFMCIYGYEPKRVVDIIGEIYSLNRDVYVKVNSREYRKHIKNLQKRFEEM